MRSQGLFKESVQINTIQDLTGVFEGIASMRISRIKNKVATSQAFFDELWGIYTQMRIDPTARMVAGGPTRAKDNIFVVITGAGGLSGDIDERIIRRVAKDFDASTTDILLIGSHGAVLLARQGISPKHTFKLPDDDNGVDVGPIIDELAGYKNPSVYYQKYLSLTVQEVGHINLLNQVQTIGSDQKGAAENLISTRDYLFEPTSEEVVGYLESVMLQIALGQVILESRLAQYASRFGAMSAAHTKAKELGEDTTRRFHRAKRMESDERLKEVINAMRLT